MVDTPEFSREVIVCQNRSCRKQGAAAVLAAFQRSAVTDITVIPGGCLGQCGNGPMVLVTPDQIWYSRVHPEEVLLVVEGHLKGGRPVMSMLYPKYHSPDQRF